MVSDVELLSGPKYIRLSANQNLDTITENGTYITVTDADAQTIINKPSGVSVKFKLVVSDTIGTTYEGAKYKRQRLYPHNSAKMYDRRASESSWSAWDEIS